jgi:hypothetical protein
MKTLVAVLAVGLMACGISFGGGTLVDGLVGYWSFDDGTASDQSGHGNHGTIVGNPQVVNGKMGNAMDFNGDDGIEIASSSSLELPNAFTVACWVYPRATKDAAGNDHAGVVWKGSLIGWGSDVYNYRVATVDDAGITFGACGGGVESHFKDSVCLDPFENWHFLAYTADGSVGIGYADGVEVGNRADAITYDTLPDQPVRIGWSQGRGGDVNTLVYFDGIIDEVAIYNRALGTSEVLAVMEQGLASLAVDPQSKLTTTWSSVKSDQ